LYYIFVFRFLDIRQAFTIAADRVQVQEDVLQRIKIAVAPGTFPSSSSCYFEVNYITFSWSLLTILMQIIFWVGATLSLNCDSLPTLISKLSLEIQNEWPLDIIFTEECTEKYNELFRYLLQVRLLQLELNTIWMKTRKIFRFPVPKGPAELRTIMSFFIDHLQHYLQV